MKKPDVFALKNSGLETFLFAEIGVQSNGLELSVLSVLARLGEEPWSKAAEWAMMPIGKVADLLAADIALMPLSSQAINGAHATALRLVRLLPAGKSMSQTDSKQAMTPIQIAFMAVLACGLAAGVALSVAAQFPHPTISAALSQAATPPR